MDALEKEFDIQVKTDVANFNEEEHNDKIINSIKEKKGSAFNKWLRRLFPWKDPVPFNPVLLSDDEYRTKARECFNNTVALLDLKNWKDDKKGPQIGDIVQTMNHETYGKIFMLTATVDCPAEFLFEEIHNKLDKVVEWNPIILESKYIRRIDDEVDLTYQLTSGGGGGAVKPRDFVNLRCDKALGDRFISAGSSVEYPGYPPTNHMRGENKISCWSIQKLAPKNPGDPIQCLFQWIMCTDMKGWLPQYILDIALPTAMFDFLHNLRVFLEKKKAEKAF